MKKSTFQFKIFHISDHRTMVYIYIGKPIDEFFRVRMLRPGVKKGKNEWNINSMGWGGRGMEGIDHFFGAKTSRFMSCPVSRQS